MAKRKIDPDRLYLVRLKRPVQIEKVWLRPGQPHRLKGRLIEEHRDAIDHIEEL